MKLACPRCGSERFRRLETLYEEQTHDTRTTGAATSFSFRHGIINHIHQSSSRTSSKLARNIAPPTKKEAGSIVLAIVLVFFIGLPLNTSIIRKFAKGVALPQPIINTVVMTTNLGLIFGVIPAICIAGGCKVWYYNRRIYPELMNMWLNSWRCDKCGNILINQPASSSFNGL